jgi:pSer/pThr/pTyr-binding forkhead associated (FHA) protein
MKVSLKLRLAGKTERLRIPIDRLPFLIGRDPVCHLRPTSLFISQHHCVIWTRGDQLLVRDLGSTNGTYLNDQAVTGEQQALNGDRLKVGPLLFDVSIEAPPTIIQPAPSPPTKNSTQSIDVEETAAMLLLLGEDASAAANRPVDLDPVPAGETVLLPARPPRDKEMSQADHCGSETNSTLSDTATVAAAILRKYLKQARTGKAGERPRS